MPAASAMPSPLDPMTARQLAERANHARRMHHRQILRRVLIVAVLAGIVGAVSCILYPVFVHLRASWFLGASGLSVQWDLDENNWMSGGVTSIVHNQRVWNSLIPDANLKYLPDLLHLQSVNLSECDLTEAGLRALAPLRELKVLDLSRLNQFHYATDIRGMGDGCIAALGGMTSLVGLSLSGHRITDKGLTMIARQYPALESLDLDATDITDAGLPALKSMKKLTLVRLGGTLVTSQGLERLRGEAPGIQIELDIDPEIQRQITEWRRRQQ